MNAAALDEGKDVPETVDVDVVGVGFGPANLAIAIALREHAEEGRPLEAVFFEAQEEPTWHPGMLLEDASMQISFLKDLVTFRNPVSPYSFVAFLHQRQRLVDFTNRGCAEPLRIEFAAYLRWVAEAFVDVVRYGSRVERVTPVRIEGEVEAFDVLVASADGVRTVRARSVIVAAGLRPRFPAGIAPGTRVWHSADHVHRVGQLRAPRRLAVVGTGQSAMEVALDLSDRFPEATVHVISSQFGVAPSDQGAPGEQDLRPGVGRPALRCHRCGARQTRRAPPERQQRRRQLLGDPRLLRPDVPRCLARPRAPGAAPRQSRRRPGGGPVRCGAAGPVGPRR
ncbi:SidA/IucD/PvdA family monooxygenase [Microbacterium oxydans]|nr:SidA/IucD/PvdA family monooxygenase [Microbacterium oxydans]